MQTIEKFIFSKVQNIYIERSQISFIFDKPIQLTGKLWYGTLDKVELSTDCLNQALNIQKM